MRRIALFLNDDFSMLRFRGGLIKELVRRGITVYAITPTGPFVRELEALGAVHVPVPIGRFLSPVADLQVIVRLLKFLRANRVDVIHNMTIKPNLLGAIAGRLAGVPRVVGLVSGLGYAFNGNIGTSSRLLRQLALCAYWVVARLTDRIWFQNADDFDLLVHEGVMPPDKGVVIRSGGIDPFEFAPEGITNDQVTAVEAELGLSSNDHLVLMTVARVVWSKGVGEFIESSRRIQSKTSRKVKFVLVGPLDPGSPEAISQAYLKSHEGDVFRWCDFRTELRPLLRRADVVVLPSAYREGVPRSLLEGLAMGKPIVTTNNVGCRETVTDGWNGFTVAVGDVDELTSRLVELLADDEKRAMFGSRSREKAINEFNQSTVVGRVLSEVYGI